MSEELVYAANLRMQITEQQDYSPGQPKPLEAHVVQKFGKLAIIDPLAARDAAEDIANAGSQTNALVQVAEHTKWRGVLGDIGPIVDSWHIAQSEIYESNSKGARPLDASIDTKKARKLNFLFQHALPLDEDLALEIAESIENPFWRAKSLLQLAGAMEDPKLLYRAAFIAKREKLRREVNDDIMWSARIMGEYRVGIDAVERRIDQEMAQSSQSTFRRYGAQEAQKDWSNYVLSCVKDAGKEDRREKLLPISDEVAEAFSMHAERQTNSEYSTASYSSIRPGWSKFSDPDRIIEMTRLAELFRVEDPEASIKLLQTARTFINRSIKADKERVAARNARERRERERTRAIEDVGLLDQDEIARELGLLAGSEYGASFDEDLKALEDIGKSLDLGQL